MITGVFENRIIYFQNRPQLFDKTLVVNP